MRRGWVRTSEYRINFRISIPVWLDYLLVWPLLLYRLLRYGYTFRRITLTQGKYAIVDCDDYFELIKYKWHAYRCGNTFYASRSIRTKDGKKHGFNMHRQVLKVPDGMFVDHINRNGLDNRKANLRPATFNQNMRNRGEYKVRNCTSKYKGVTWHREGKCWQARIIGNHKYIHLGSFRDELKAAKAYDKAAIKYHGEFAALNFPHLAKKKRRRVTKFVRTCLDSINLNT